MDTIAQALDGLRGHAIGVPGENSDIWPALLVHAPSQPMRVYAIAASYRQESVCILASPYTLVVSLDMLTDDDALAMGSIYLRRLALLHAGRRDALRRVVVRPPNRHSPTESCSSQQDSVAFAWELVVADIFSLPLPHASTVGRLFAAFSPLILSTTCVLCQETVRARVNEVIRAWNEVKEVI